MSATEYEVDVTTHNGVMAYFTCIHYSICPNDLGLWPIYTKIVWLSGVVVSALDLRLEIAGSIPAAALSSATLDKLFTRMV